MMPAPDLRHRVTFAKRVELTDEYGATRGEWVDQFTLAATIRPRLGGETIIAARLAGTQPVTITIRQSIMARDILPEWKARNERSGTEYAIRSIVDPDEHSADHGRWFDLICEAGVAP